MILLSKNKHFRIGAVTLFNNEIQKTSHDNNIFQIFVNSAIGIYSITAVLSYYNF